MFHVAILGAGNVSRMVRRIIDGPYNQMMLEHGNDSIETVAFIHANRENEAIVDGLAAFSLEQFCYLYKKSVVQAIIMPREVYFSANCYLTNLVYAGVDINDIYIAERLQEKEYTPTNVMDFLKPYPLAPYLSYLEFHVADHCNLNCAACEHYSGLVHEAVFPDFARFKQDFYQLKRFIKDIGTLRILGGEPLLNPELEQYLDLARSLYPDTQIMLVTNGLLLRNMAESFWEAMRRNDIFLSLSFYLPMQDKMEELKQFLENKGINGRISPLMKEFSVKQTLVKQADPWPQYYNCFQSHCHNLYEGKLAACFLPFMTKYFNREFNKNLPEDGAIDLYEDGLTLEDIKLRLLIPFERCCYCTNPKFIPWRQIHKPSILADWILDE